MSKVHRDRSATPASRTQPSTQPRKARSADELRAQIAQWAIKQANDPNVGYSQGHRLGGTKGGHRYFDCSGLCDSAYRAFGIKSLGNMRTATMWKTHEKWATTIPPKLSEMKPGDLILMKGHVVMYTGNGRCVSANTNYGNVAGTTNTNFAHQVTANVSAADYLARDPVIVLRPKITEKELAKAPASAPLELQTGTMRRSGGGHGHRGSGEYDAPAHIWQPAPISGGMGFADWYMFFYNLLTAVSSGDAAGAQAMLAAHYPGAPHAQLAEVAALLQANPELAEKIRQDPSLLDKLVSSPESVKELRGAGNVPGSTGTTPGGQDAFVSPDAAPVALASYTEPLQVDPSTVDPALVSDVHASMTATIPA